MSDNWAKAFNDDPGWLEEDVNYNVDPSLDPNTLVIETPTGRQEFDVTWEGTKMILHPKDG